MAEGIGVVDVYAAIISPMTRLADDLAPGANATLDAPRSSLMAAGDPIVILIDVAGDGTPDATFNLPASDVLSTTFPGLAARCPSSRDRTSYISLVEALSARTTRRQRTKRTLMRATA